MPPLQATGEKSAFRPTSPPPGPCLNCISEWICAPSVNLTERAYELSGFNFFCVRLLPIDPTKCRNLVKTLVQAPGIAGPIT